MTLVAPASSDRTGHTRDSTVRILQLTDCHFPPVAGQLIQGIDTERSFSGVAKSALVSERSYDLLLLTGDLADNPTESAYRRLRARLLALNWAKPCYCLPGNHDDIFAMREFLLGGEIRMESQIVLDHWQIVCLDSNIAGEPGGFLEERQFALLHEAIVSEPAKHLLVVVHHHPIPCGSEWMDTMIIGNGQLLVALLQTVRHRACAVVFGHIHQAFDRTMEGIRFLGSPSTCCQFKPDSRDFCLDTLPPGYRWIELRDSGDILTGVEYPSS